MESKQVLVMKKFPKARNMRTGKYCAQAAHASMGAILGIGRFDSIKNEFVIPLGNPFVASWITGRFKKVTVYVNDDVELIAVYDAARKAGLAVSLIRDAGLTEFDGVPTLTAVGIGPDSPELIDKITGDLPLF
jgi:PTH2 family peptidyl-tRNA hydrolase